MGIYFDNKIYGVRIESASGSVIYEYVSHKELSKDDINTAKNHIVDGVVIYVYVQATSTYENPSKNAYLWRGVTCL